MTRWNVMETHFYRWNYFGEKEKKREKATPRERVASGATPKTVL